MARKLIFIFFVGLHTACTIMDEPVDEVRVEVTTVSPTPSSPTATLSPTETAVPSSPSTILGEEAAAPQLGSMKNRVTIYAKDEITQGGTTSQTNGFGDN